MKASELREEFHKETLLDDKIVEMYRYVRERALGGYENATYTVPFLIYSDITDKLDEDGFYYRMKSIIHDDVRFEIFWDLDGDDSEVKVQEEVRRHIIPSSVTNKEEFEDSVKKVIEKAVDNVDASQRKMPLWSNILEHGTEIIRGSGIYEYADAQWPVSQWTKINGRVIRVLGQGSSSGFLAD